MRIAKSSSIFANPTVITLIFLFAACAVQAQKMTSKPSTASVTDQWLQFRGPNGSGIAEGATPPAEFGANKNLAWKTAVPFARSSPVVTANRVFLTASEGDKLITLALDRKTGKILWRSEIPRARHMEIYKANDPASPSPVSDGKNVYAFFAELGLIAYGPSGKELWRLPLGPFNSFYGMAGSPVLAGNKLLLVCDHRNNSFVVAVDTRTGKLLWKKERSNFEGYSTPSIYTPKDGPAQLLVLGSQTLDAYSLDNGERLWWVTKVGSYTKGVPVVGADMVYVLGEGGDAPFFPVYEDSLKKYDKDNDQRIHIDEMKAKRKWPSTLAGWTLIATITSLVRSMTSSAIPPPVGTVLPRCASAARVI